MVNIKKILLALIGNNVIIVKVGEKPHLTLFYEALSLDDYKRLTKNKVEWLKFEVTHIEPLGNTLRVEIKENTL